MRKRLLGLILSVAMLTTSCGFFDSKVNDLRGDISGNTYDIDFYSDYGSKVMTVSGKKINISGNYIEEVNSDGSTKDVLSSVVTFTIDGKEIENCGTTLLIKEKGLNPELDYINLDISSKGSNKISDLAVIAKPLNKYKNMFGKSRIVLIQTDLSQPICAFSGDNVYWKIPSNLPKTTKLMIDGKALYIHRAKFQIIDKALLAD